MFGSINTIGKGLFFDGKRGKPVNIEDANKFIRLAELQEVELELYGDKRKEKLPIEEKGDIITNEFLRFIGKCVQDNTITDIKYRERYAILKLFDAVKTDYGFGLKYKQEQENKDYDNIDMLLAKEFIDGLWNIDTYKVEGNTKEFPIGFDFDIKVGEGEHKIFGNYGVNIREHGSDKTKWFYKQTGMYDQHWQIDLKKHLGKETFFACPRRSGKTHILCQLAVLEIMKYNPGKKPIQVVFITDKGDNMEGIVAYLKQYTQYFSDKLKGIFNYKPSESTFSFNIPQEINGEVTWKTNGKIKLFTAGGKDAAVGYYADLVIIDEANLVSEKVYFGVLPIVKNEGARLICASTVYEDMDSEQWFYKKLVEYEIENYLMGDINTWIEKFREENNIGKLIEDENIEQILELKDKAKYERKYVGIRYGFDEIDVLQQPGIREEFEAMKRDNPRGYYCQKYCAYPEEVVVFNYQKCIKEIRRNEYYDFIVMARDPAESYDGSALLVGGIAYGQIYVLEEHLLGGDYANQLDQIVKLEKDLLRKYGNKEKNNVLKIIDGTGVGHVIGSFTKIMDIKFDFSVNSHAGNKITKEAKFHNVPKDKLVEILKQMMVEESITFSNNLEQIFTQFDTFSIVHSTSGRKVYRGKGKAKDDFVTACMILNYYIYEKLGGKKSIIERQVQDSRESRNDFSIPRLREEENDGKKRRNIMYKDYITKYKNSTI